MVRRGLFAWKEELMGKLCFLLQNVTLQVDKEDRWLWKLESSQDFTIRSVYKVMVNQHHYASMVSPEGLWHKDIPLKVVLFAWRLIRDRLPTKDNLFRRGVIASDARLCLGGCGSLETSPHLFLHCHFLCEVWQFIHRWLGVCSVISSVPADYLNQFGAVGGNCSQLRRSFLFLIGMLLCGKYGKERNNRIFNGKQCSTLQIVDKIKALSFVWLKAKLANLSLTTIFGGLVR